jgi:hypothetical protein
MRGRSGWVLGRGLFLAMLVASLTAIQVTPEAAGAPSVGRSGLSRARSIGTELEAAYGRHPGNRLKVTNVSTTAVVESFTLMTPDLSGARRVPTRNGIYVITCSARTHCPYPSGRDARNSADLLPRQFALELALRTLRETSIDVVAIALPTPRVTLLVVERADLIRDPDLQHLSQALAGGPTHRAASWGQQEVEAATRPRTYVVLGLEPTPTGRETLAAAPRWPQPSETGDGPIL